MSEEVPSKQTAKPTVPSKRRSWFGLLRRLAIIGLACVGLYYLAGVAVRVGVQNTLNGLAEEQGLRAYFYVDRVDWFEAEVRNVYLLNPEENDGVFANIASVNLAYKPWQIIRGRVDSIVVSGLHLNLNINHKGEIDYGPFTKFIKESESSPDSSANWTNQLPNQINVQNSNINVYKSSLVDGQEKHERSYRVPLTIIYFPKDGKQLLRVFLSPGNSYLRAFFDFNQGVPSWSFIGGSIDLREWTDLSNDKIEVKGEWKPQDQNHSTYTLDVTGQTLGSLQLSGEITSTAEKNKWDVKTNLGFQGPIPGDVVSTLLKTGVDLRGLKDLSLKVISNWQWDATENKPVFASPFSFTVVTTGEEVGLIGLARAAETDFSTSGRIDLASDFSAKLTVDLLEANLKNLTLLSPPSGILMEPVNISLSTSNLGEQVTLEALPDNWLKSLQIKGLQLSASTPQVTLPGSAQLSGVSGVLILNMDMNASGGSLQLLPGSTLGAQEVRSAIPGAWSAQPGEFSLADTQLTWNAAGWTVSGLAKATNISAMVDRMDIAGDELALKVSHASAAAPGSSMAELLFSGFDFTHEAARLKVQGVSGNLPVDLTGDVDSEGTLTGQQVLINGVASPGFTGTFSVKKDQLAMALDWPLLDEAVVKASGWVDVSGSRRLAGLNVWMPEFELKDLAQLKQAFPALESVSLTGTFKVDAAVEWDGNRAFPQAEVWATNANLVSRTHDAELTGLTGYVYLDSFTPVSSLPGMKVQATGGRLGKFNVSEGLVVFGIEKPTPDRPSGSVLIEEAKFGLAGGEVAARGFRVDFATGSTRLVINADGMNLQPVLDMAESDISGQGRLYARVPVGFEFPRLTELGRGYVYAEPGLGALGIKSLSAEFRQGIDAAAGVQPNQPPRPPQQGGLPDATLIRDRILAALANFEFSVLRADFRPDGPWIRTNIRLAGKGKPGTGEQQLDINPNVSFKLEDLNELLNIREKIYDSFTP